MIFNEIGGFIWVFMLFWGGFYKICGGIVIIIMGGVVWFIL